MEKFDLHPKPSNSVRKKTVSGGLFTAATALMVLTLLILKPALDPAEDLLVDSMASKHPLDFHFDVLFLDMSVCDKIKVEVLDSIGRPINLGQSIQAKSGWLGHGCSVVGHVVAPPSRGTFRFFFDGLLRPGDLAEKGRHQIRALYVGESSELSYIPLQATQFSLSEESVCPSICYWTYFVKIIPTTSNSVDGYQLAGTRHYQSLQAPNQYAGSLAFSYETSSLRMTITQRSYSWFHSLTSMLGVIGGTVAIMALVGACATARSNGKSLLL